MVRNRGFTQIFKFSGLNASLLRITLSLADLHLAVHLKHLLLAVFRLQREPAELQSSRDGKCALAKDAPSKWLD